ncbi:MAG: endonuclease/exonuclease/phosphatase family protein [Polyangia bacterium]|jgi:endonuclease/exonuclease/phosphatase family metal-dependent hydrolase
MIAKRLRCLTLNLWGAEAPLDRRMQVVVAALRALNPDVVALQEVREALPRLPNQAQAIGEALGLSHVFSPATPVEDGQEGLAILSTGPIIEQRTLALPHAQPKERRILLSARVSLGQGSLWVHTTHLNYRLAHGKEREDQVKAIEASLVQLGGERPQILMGDFNARPESDEIRWLRGQVTLEGRRTYFQDAWERIHPGEPGWTWATANPYTARLAFLEPDRRIDYIFVTAMRGDGRGTVHDCRIVLDRGEPDGVFASDHFGLCAEIQVEAT